MAGLLAALARRHEVSAVSLLTPQLDRAEVERSMRAYCRETVLVPAPALEGKRKRLLQLRSLVGRPSFERRAYELPAVRRAVQVLLAERRFDALLVAFPFLAGEALTRPPAGAARPVRVLDEHNIEFDLARQQAVGEHGLLRWIHNRVNWPKLRREEVAAWSTFDGVTFCSEADRARARALVPDLQAAVVPNAVDVDEFRPRPGDPAPDGATVLFFGAINYFPNVDGLGFFLREVWPILERSHPRARLKIVGQAPTPEILAHAGPRIEVTGRVPDLRPHLSAAAVTIAPLRIGGGTRFKILEAMAMARPVVSTPIGAEGLEAEPGRQLLLAETAEDFAAAVGRVLDDAALGSRLGAAGRMLVEERYSWQAAGERLERFLLTLVESAVRALG